MSRILRNLAAVLLLGAALLTTDSRAASVRIDGSLSPSDSVAGDAFGEFRYDAYNLVVSGPTTLSVTLSSGDFAPWLGAWDQELLPTPRWEANDPTVYDLALSIDSTSAANETVGLTFHARPGTPYQVAAAGAGHSPAVLGSYRLRIESAPGVEVRVAAVPLPSGLPLLLAALPALLALGRRRACELP